MSASRVPSRAIAISLVLHVAVAVGAWLVVRESPPPDDKATTLVDLDLAPASPEAEVMAAAAAVAEQAARELAATQAPAPAQEASGTTATLDAQGPTPDARLADDAAPEPDARRRRPDAALVAVAADAAVVVTTAISDAGLVASTDGGVTGDGTLLATATTDGGAGGDGSATDGTDGTGGPGPVATAATKANLLAYVPPGHTLTVLLRLDRMRGTRWATPIADLFKSMPDYRAVVGDRTTPLVDLFDSLVMSTSDPNAVDATILVARTRQTRPALRDFLDEPDAPVTWSTTTGGLLGTRGAGERVVSGDTRVFLSPFLGWFVLAQPADLPGMLTAAGGDLDSAVATASMPPWLAKVRGIEPESGDPDGPAMILTMSSRPKRYPLPDLARRMLGVSSSGIPSPRRMTVSLEIDPNGFVIKGNATFGTAADATEVYTLATAAAKTAAAAGSTAALMSPLARLSVREPTGTTVTFATSMSTRDAIAGLALAGKMLAQHYSDN